MGQLHRGTCELVYEWFDVIFRGFLNMHCEAFGNCLGTRAGCADTFRRFIRCREMDCALERAFDQSIS